jgi:hypothetical protein
MGADHKIRIPRLTWSCLVWEMYKRGKGRHESGAFLLGKAGANDRHVESFICYDDLDPVALSSGIVTFHGKGFTELWDICSKNGLQVLADVHTHPTADVRQSRIDKDHPMLPVQGHTALIMPHFGRASAWSLSGVGMHVFQGHGIWKSFSSNHPDAPVSLCIW